MKFENVSILTDGIKDIIKDMRYCWWVSVFDVFVSLSQMHKYLCTISLRNTVSSLYVALLLQMNYDGNHAKCLFV